MQPPIVPYLQGDLDGLCALYALVNGVRAIFPSLEHAAAEDLFRHLVDCLEARSFCLGTVHEGIGDHDLRRLALECRDYLASEGELPLKVGYLPLRQRISIQGIWRGLQQAVESPAVAVIGIMGREQHWTTVWRVTARRLYLLDSGCLKALDLSRCTAGPTRGRYHLDPSSIIVLRRDGRPRRRRT